jgi:hypothetical protein
MVSLHGKRKMLMNSTGEEKPPHYYHEVNCACTKCMPDVNTLMEDQRDFE